MKNTQNYSFNKPDRADLFKLSDWNDNMDLIDAAIKEAEKKGGSMILWRGALFCGGSTEFNVPAECFHNNQTTLTLLIDGYYKNSIGVGGLGANLGISGVTLCPCSAADFGLTDMENDSYGPYKDGSGNAYAHLYRPDNMVYEHIAVLNIGIRVKKVPDTRYAVCKLTMDDDPTFNTAIVTCISAIAPSELEA